MVSNIIFRECSYVLRFGMIILILLPVLLSGCIEKPSKPVPMATPMATPSSTSEGTITRIIQFSTIQPGSSFTITLTPTPSTLFDLPGYQVIETVPPGFNVTANTASIASHVGNVWTFTNIGSATIDYTLTAPETADTSTFSGIFKDENSATGEVSGSSVIVVGTSSNGTFAEIPSATAPEVTPPATIPRESPLNTRDFIITSE